MTESRKWRLKAGAAALHVVDEGDVAAPAVLFGHSIMTSGAMWQWQVGTVRSAGCRSIRYDARGHGKSTATPPPYTIAELADDAVAVMDGLGIERVHYVGLSLGGIVALRLASHHADRLASVVVCDCRADSTPAFTAPWPERIAQARVHGIAPLVEPTMRRWFGEAFLVTAAADAMRLILGETSVDGYVGAASALLDFDYRRVVEDLPVPATFIAGEHDGALPEAMGALAALAHCPLEIVEGTGHLPNVEDHAAFDAALLRHLRRGGVAC